MELIWRKNPPFANYMDSTLERQSDVVSIEPFSLTYLLTIRQMRVSSPS